MEVILRRHAMTAGNRLNQYIGAIDQDLSPEGETTARLCGDGPDETVQKVYCSPMRRAVRSARIFYPQAQIVLKPLLREMDFGIFEGKSYKDLAGDPVYQEWLDSNCQDPCPGGEQMEEFSRRVCRGFEQIMEEAAAQREEQVVIVAHGGTLMAVMSLYAAPRKGYFEWQIPNCGGYQAQWSSISRQLTDWKPLNLGGKR